MSPTPVSVLLVEDDPSIAELYAIKLRMDGYTVHHAADGTTAEVIFDGLRPQVVCLDHRLPDRQGADAAGRYAAAGAIVVLLTNDQEHFEEPPPGVTRALLKARTSPTRLSETILALVGRGIAR